MHVVLPADYPFRAPKISFLDKLFHPQIGGDRICAESLSSGWSPRTTVLDAILAVRETVDNPDTNNAINSWAGALYSQPDKEPYAVQVRLTLPLLSEEIARARCDALLWTETLADSA